MILKLENLDIQVFITFDVVEKFQNMILTSILVNNFDSKSFNDDFNDIDSESKNIIDQIIVLTLNLKQIYQNNQ